MSREVLLFDDQIERLRFESKMLHLDKPGRYDSPTEELRRKKIEKVNGQLALRLDREGLSEAYYGYEHFISGGTGRSLSQLKRNP